MLKYIVFCLSEKYCEALGDDREKMAAEVSAHHVKMIFSCRQESGNYPKEETLVITDLAQRFAFYREKGWYVIALYHEENRREQFAGARYGVEDVELLEYESYDEAYRRLAGIPWNILETKRLWVRESTVEDVEDFYRIYSDPSITCYIEDLYREREEEQAYMKAYIDKIYGFYGFGLWTVLLKESGQIIGRAGLSIREGYDLPELGFVIDVEHQRQGYGLEVCRGILSYAERKLEFDRVQALADENNVRSLHLLGKLGFEFERSVSGFDRHYKLYVKTL